MLDSRRFFAPLILVALVGTLAGCAKQQTQATATPPPSPEVSASAVAPAAASPDVSPASSAVPATSASPGSVAAAATASPVPTATPVPNLLSVQNGTVVRAYPAVVSDPAHASEGFAVPAADDPGPWVFVYELAGTADITRIGAQPPAKGTNGEASTLRFAVSTTSAVSGFHDLDKIASTSTSDAQTVVVTNGRARWVRVTVDRKGAAQPTNSMAVFGTFVSSPAARPDGTYVQYGNPYDQGVFRAAPNENDPWYLQVATIAPNGINAQQCFNGHLGDTYPGTLDGRTWTWRRSDAAGAYVVNDDASLIVGTLPYPTYWVRTTQRPKYCVPIVAGTGKNNVLVLESHSHALYPTGDDTAKDAPAFRFTHVGAGFMDQALLAAASTVVLNGLCISDDLIAPAQGQALAQWVQNGHKLLIVDSDMCSKTTHYSLLPYQFTSNNPGAQGAKGDRLIQVEDDSLGTSDKTDKAHFFDPVVYAQNGNQLGDANTVTTQDPHWCGHLFGTNVNHVNGFMQMYSLYGKGLILYDGFDHDDGGVPSYQRVRLLELAQPIPPDLPCTQKASLAFVIQPNREASFTPGKAVKLPFAMELLANQGWKGHITMSTSGDFRAAVTPNSFDVNGTTQALKIAVSIPANAKPGQYAIIVNGDGGNGANAQATIQLHAAVALVKQLKSQRRIRIYGIHFDVDKATIKPQSEPVIAQIAQVMKQNPSWRFRVEGHTDSDGGLQHNAVLSQHRAESVVGDLVKRYHIARSRLVPAGYGYSKPVAPNTTSAGKALNRRVELFLLNAK